LEFADKNWTNEYVAHFVRGNERRPLLRIKTNIRGFKEYRLARNLLVMKWYVHKWVQWSEHESDHKTLFNVAIMSGAIILSLYMTFFF